MITAIKPFVVDGVVYREILSKIDSQIPSKRDSNLGATRSGGMYVSANEGMNKVANRIYVQPKELMRTRIVTLSEQTVKQKFGVK